MKNESRHAVSIGQKGAALLVMLLVVITAFGAVMISSLSAANVDAQRQKKTLDTLAQGKQALIAWSVLNGDIGTNTHHRPGALPCPEDPATPGQQKSTCVAATGSAIGRLPWKTLGIDELRDANGERLWYVVSNNFRPAPPNYLAINSDSKGTLLLYAADGSALLTPGGEELAAVVFSAGPPLALQDRGAGPNIAANYLDSGNGRNNALATGPFIAGPAKNAAGNVIVNDLVTGISARELIAAVEKRVLKEAQDALASYALANGGKFPNPAKFNGTNCAASISDIRTPTTCAKDNTVCFGRFPEDIPVSSTWFSPNGWGRVITYAVNRNAVQDSSAAECSAALNVGGLSKSYVLFAPGSALGALTRPSNSLANYLEDASNNDAWTSLSSGQASFSATSSAGNDQIRSIP